ncbi:MAG: hypothetical protein JW973_18630 [Bacteroidales bacterium]|nr:hypothetical protein [Bacteroidales bacterium]
METQNQKKIEPTFGGSFGNGWDVMSRYFLVLLLVVIVLGIIWFPTQFMNIKFDSDTFPWMEDWRDHIGIGGFAVLGAFAIILGIFAFFYALLVVPVFKYGANLMFVHAVRGIRPEFETLVKGFRENYLHIVLANLLTVALIMLGMILLIVPGIIVACRLAFVSYLVMDRKLDPIIAVEESWRLTRGYGWTIFGMAFVSFFIFIAGLIMLFVGILPATIWVKSSFASLYDAVLTTKNGSVMVTEG